MCLIFVLLFKQKTAYEMRISDWSSDVCSSDLKAGQGRIVAISSRAALGKELRTSYAASKSALHGLMKTWALELARDGITANAIGPGSIETPLWHAANPSQDPRTQKILDSIPVGRPGTPAAIANAVSFFLDARSGFVTGQVLYVCGGLTVST